jgi:hypothetical protein
MTEKELMRLLLEEQRETRQDIKELIKTVAFQGSKIESIDNQISTLCIKIEEHGKILTEHAVKLSKKPTKSIFRPKNLIETAKLIGFCILGLGALAGAIFL